MAVELDQSGSWSITLASPSELVVERMYWESWSAAPAFVGSALGLPDPVFPLARCVEARVEPVGVITASPADYSHAKITLRFRATTEVPSADSPLPGNPTLPGDASVSVRVTGTREVIAHPVVGLRYGDNLTGNPVGPIPTDEAQGRTFVPVEEWHITLRNLVMPNYSRLNAKKGHVNSTTFLGHAPETVLFESYDIELEWRYVSGNWTRTYAVTWHFRVREVTRKNSDNTTTTVGWNHVLRGGDWVTLYVNQHEKLYPATSFADIFT